ncbi:histone deacetylase [Acrasis kona]|uniref:Histone deacetylase n=1 Tax=Acrasis kona TaxID=1008807 RepID=A0AAW2YYP8_9EUKA
MIWYLSYGSNLNKDRFMKYIIGGSLNARATNKKHHGCRDPTPPKSHLFTFLPHVELYFARQSLSWQNGGVCFIRENYKGGGTIARMYLITKEQFVDVVGQENRLSQDYITKTLEPKVDGFLNNLDGDKTLSNTFFMSSLLPTSTYYDNLVFLGYRDGFPILSFTSSEINQPSVRPSENYIRTIFKGMMESNEYTLPQCVGYLIEKSGVRNQYDQKELLNVVTTEINT